MSTDHLEFFNSCLADPELNSNLVDPASFLNPDIFDLDPLPSAEPQQASFPAASRCSSGADSADSLVIHDLQHDNPFDFSEVNDSSSVSSSTAAEEYRSSPLSPTPASPSTSYDSDRATKRVRTAAPSGASTPAPASVSTPLTNTSSPMEGVTDDQSDHANVLAHAALALGINLRMQSQGSSQIQASPVSPTVANGSDGSSKAASSTPTPQVLSLPLPLPHVSVKLEPQQLTALAQSGLGGLPLSLPLPLPVPVPMDVDTIRELIREQGVKKQRLARKAELARMSRKRKKTRLTDLEDEVRALKDELENERRLRKIAQDQAALAQSQAKIALSAQAAAVGGTEAEVAASLSEASVAEEWKLHIDQLRKSMASAAHVAGQPSQDVAKAVADVNALMKRRGAASVQQTRVAQKFLASPLPLRFLEWVMNQKDAFYQDTAGLWSSLFQREVGLTAEQLQSISALRPLMQQQRATSAELQSVAAKMASLVHTRSAQASAAIDKLASVLTPEQLSKFFNWVENYGSVCVQINL